MLARLWNSKKSLNTPAKRAMFKAFSRVTRPVDFAQRKYLAAMLPPAAPAELDLSRTDGWALLPRGSVAGTDEAVDACLKVFERRKSNLDQIIADTNSKKPNYFFDVLDDNGFDEFTEMVVSYMTQDAIVHTVMRYLGEYPVFQGARMFWTPPNDSVIGSQQWHFDGLDSRQVKFFLYLSNIDKEAGPTTIISRSDSDKLKATLQYIHGRITDDEVAAIIPRDRWIPLAGPIGSIAVCDTSSCVHFGGRSRGRGRLFLMFHYSTSAPFTNEVLPPYIRRSIPDTRLLTAR